MFRELTRKNKQLSTEDCIAILKTQTRGVLSVNDKSDPQDVARLTGMSKKVFKRALGMLLKAGKVEQTETGIKCKK